MEVSNSFCSAYGIVKKGHSECGDSAFFYSDSEKAIFGVFDGVSGESNASNASSTAAKICLEKLRLLSIPLESDLINIVSSASDSISKGYTTAVILFITKKGDFAICSVGDSPIYSISNDGKVDNELPIGRVVGDDDSVFKFLQHRNYVTSVLGHSGKDIQIHTKLGKITSQTSFVICSDGLSDNLFFESFEGAVADSAGLNDLSLLLVKIASKNNSPKNVVSYLENTVADRIQNGRIEEDNRIMVPKEDDLSIIYINFCPQTKS